MADAIPETPLNKKIVPVRGAAQKAVANIRQQSNKHLRTSQGDKTSDVESDAGAITDDDDMSVDGSPKGKGKGKDSRGRGRGRPRGRPRGRGRGRGTGTDRRNSEQIRVERKPSTRSLESRRESSALSTHSSSSLSSLPNTPQKRSWPIETSSTPSKRAKVSISHRNINTSIPSSSSTSKDTFTYARNELVWVRLHLEGALADSPTVDAEESYWWPAQVTSEDILEVSVKLFGNDGYGRDRLLDIKSPTPFTILPFRHQNDVRFSSSNFTLAGAVPEESLSSPRIAAEEEPSGLALCWEAARDQALTVDMDEELPEADALWNLMSTQSKSKRQEKPNIESPETPTPSPRKITHVVPLDMEIKVGEDDGEMVLARDHKDRRDYWPARVIGVSQSKRTGKWLYEVRFIDGKKRKIDRSWFFASEEEGFATCRVGEWHTDYPVSDTAGSDSDEQFDALDDRRSTSPSPLETDLPVATEGQFRTWPLWDQMRYVFPFLCRVIRREYEPSFHRHDAFMKGGKAREQLGQTASVRGHLSENEVNRVSKLVRKVMLRDERRAKRLYDENEVQKESRTPQAESSDGTKVESVAESIFAHSSDLDAAMALTELKSSEELMLPSPPPPSVTFTSRSTEQKETTLDASQNPINDWGNAQSSVTIVPSPGLATEMDTDVHRQPPVSEMSISVLGHSSETGLSSGPKESFFPQTIPDDNVKDLPAITGLASQGFISPVSVPFLRTTVVPTSRPRPIGCEGYESLSRSERGLYCSDVLLPEAILQLHLFRDGHRSFPTLLTPEEEERLYKKGGELMQQEEYWVTQFLQLHKLAVQTWQKRSKGKEKAPPAVMPEETSSRRARRKT